MYLKSVFIALISVIAFILTVKFYDWLICTMFGVESSLSTVYASFCLAAMTVVLGVTLANS